MRKFWNQIRWGSAEGPKIVIDWDKRSVTLQRCSVGMTYPDWVTFLLMVDKLALHPDVEPNRRFYLYSKSPW